MKLKQGDLVEFRKTPKGKLYHGYIVGFYNGMYHIKHINKKAYYLIEPKDVIPTKRLYK